MGAGIEKGTEAVGKVGANVDLKIVQENDFEQKKQEHYYDKSGDTVVESHTNSHVVDKSTEILGLKVAGTTETTREVITKVQSKDEGLLLNTKKTDTTQESIHFKEEHNPLSGSIDVIEEKAVTHSEVEHELTACGMCMLVPLVKVAVEIYNSLQSGHSIKPSHIAKRASDAALSSIALAALSAVLGPQILLAVMAVLSMCPPLARGEPEKARDNALRIFKSVFISQTVGLFVRSCLWMTPLAPFAKILGMGAGMASSLLLSDVDVVKMLKKIAKEAQQSKPKAISA